MRFGCKSMENDAGNGEPFRGATYLRWSPQCSEATSPLFQRTGGRKKRFASAALTTLLRKFKGPGAYEGLWEFLTQTYQALAAGAALPVTANDVICVNRMVDALKPQERRP